MPSKLAILIPTYGRSERLERVAANIHGNTKTDHTIYFIVESQDFPTIKELERIKEKFIINVAPYTYVKAINYGYEQTTEPFIFCGADDLDFTQGWDSKALSCFNDQIGIVGVYDDFPVVQTGKHASHFICKREYIKQFGGAYDEENTIYSNSYKHWNPDVETLHLAMRRNAFYLCKEAVVDHVHWSTGKCKKDITYEWGEKSMKVDGETFEKRRRHFEAYWYNGLWQGQIMPVFPPKRLSIVLPSFNALQFLKITLKQIEEKTYYDFDLIIIDDRSDQEVVGFLRSEYQLNRPNCTVRLILNTEQKFTNYNWNLGIKESKNSYIAILNNDIELSRHWDIPLTDALDKGASLANPYQTDPGMHEPYGKHERTGNIDIRGTCFMLKKNLIYRTGFIPECLKLWCGDSWLAWRVVDVLGEKSEFIKYSQVHHFGSKSSNEFDKKTGKLRELQEADNLAFIKLIEIEKSGGEEVKVVGGGA